MARAPGDQSKKIPVELVQFLIVDDHGFVRHIVGEVLKSKKIKRCAFASDGGEALHMLKLYSPKTSDTSLVDMIGSRPDIAGDLYPEAASFSASHAYCVITDFKMGAINGLHLLKAIRCGETRVPRDTPVILLTGFSDDFVVSVALQLDVNAFVLKPVSHNTLWEKVQRVLKSVTAAQDVTSYERIEIPNDAGELTPKKAASNPDISPDDNDESLNWAPLGAVLPGAVLARDLYGASGALLLRQGTVFSAGVIQKLTDLEKMNALNGKIPLKPSVGGKREADA